MIDSAAKKTFTRQQATFLLAHSMDYDTHSVEVEESVFRAMLRLPPRDKEDAPPPVLNWTRDEQDGHAPEKEYCEWEAYFHPMHGEDLDLTEILFNRKMLEQEAGMSAQAARNRYGKLDASASLSL